MEANQKEVEYGGPICALCNVTWVRPLAFKKMEKKID